MKIHVNNLGQLELGNVYNGIVINTQVGDYILCERDGKLEVILPGGGVWVDMLSDNPPPGFAVYEKERPMKDRVIEILVKWFGFILDDYSGKGLYDNAANDIMALRYTVNTTHVNTSSVLTRDTEEIMERLSTSKKDDDKFEGRKVTHRPGGKTIWPFDLTEKPHTCCDCDCRNCQPDRWFLDTDRDIWIKKT